MTGPIGVGVVGLSARGNWGALAHWPALQAVPGVELRGLTAGSPESTAAAAEYYGVPGFGSVAELADRDDVDLIAITVRVPEHRRLLEPILRSGKAILSEWPLALDVAEAEALRDASAGAGPRFIGLQGRESPTIRWVRDLLREGFVGDVLSSAMLLSFPGGGPTFTAGSAYTADAANGATMMTIPFAHSLDLQTMLLGKSTGLRAITAVQRTEAVVTDTGATISKTSPDQIAVLARLPGGAVASMHFRAGAFRTTPFLWEIDGSEGSLLITGAAGLPMSTTLHVEGARGRESMTALAEPPEYDRFPALRGTPAHNVAHLYDAIARNLTGEEAELQTFADGVVLHRTLASIEALSAIAEPTT